jgi:hypothetical protein
MWRRVYRLASKIEEAIDNKSELSRLKITCNRMHTKNYWLLTITFLALVMAPYAAPAQDDYGPPGGEEHIGIVRALYGRHGHYIDVTRIVRDYAWQGAEMEVSNETFGFDPYKGEEKKLRVIFSGPDGNYERTWDEGDTVRF